MGHRLSKSTRFAPVAILLLSAAPLRAQDAMPPDPAAYVAAARALSGHPDLRPAWAEPAPAPPFRIEPRFLRCASRWMGQEPDSLVPGFPSCAPRFTPHGRPTAPLPAPVMDALRADGHDICDGRCEPEGDRAIVAFSPPLHPQASPREGYTPPDETVALEIQVLAPAAHRAGFVYSLNAVGVLLDQSGGTGRVVDVVTTYRQPSPVARTKLDLEGRVRLTIGDTLRVSARTFDAAGRPIEADVDWEVFSGSGALVHRGGGLLEAVARGGGTIRVRPRPARIGVPFDELSIQVRAPRTTDRDAPEVTLERMASERSEIYGAVVAWLCATSPEAKHPLFLSMRRLADVGHAWEASRPDRQAGELDPAAVKSLLSATCLTGPEPEGAVLHPAYAVVHLSPLTLVEGEVEVDVVMRGRHPSEDPRRGGWSSSITYRLARRVDGWEVVDESMNWIT